MLRILGRWAASALPVLLLVSMLTFLLSSLIPGDVARVILGVNATQQQIDALTQQLGLDEPLLVRYWDWLVAALHGDLGTSIINGQSVSQSISERIGLTLSLIIGAVIIAGVLGVSLGV